MRLRRGHTRRRAPGVPRSTGAPGAPQRSHRRAQGASRRSTRRGSAQGHPRRERSHPRRARAEDGRDGTVTLGERGALGAGGGASDGRAARSSCDGVDRGHALSAVQFDERPADEARGSGNERVLPSTAVEQGARVDGDRAHEQRVPGQFLLRPPRRHQPGLLTVCRMAPLPVSVPVVFDVEIPDVQKPATASAVASWDALLGRLYCAIAGESALSVWLLNGHRPYAPSGAAQPPGITRRIARRPMQAVTVRMTNEWQEGREPGVRGAALQGPEAPAAVPPPRGGPAPARRARRALARAVRDGRLSRAPARRGHRAPQVRRGPRRGDDPHRVLTRCEHDEGRPRGPAPHPRRAHAVDRASHRGVTLGRALPARGRRAARARRAAAGRSPPRAGACRRRQRLVAQMPPGGLRILRAPAPRRAGQVPEVRHASVAGRRSAAGPVPRTSGTRRRRCSSRRACRSRPCSGSSGTRIRRSRRRSTVTSTWRTCGRG
jgi:hypothetical protein